MASAPFSTAALAHSQSPAGASSSGRRGRLRSFSAPSLGLVVADEIILFHDLLRFACGKIRRNESKSHAADQTDDMGRVRNRPEHARQADKKPHQRKGQGLL